MTVYAYMRVSTQEQVDGTSLANQKRECKGLAMTHGVYIDRYIEDGGVSGADPFFERLEQHDADLRSGDVIIVAKLDRFSRDAADALGTIKELQSRGVRLIINGHGDVTDEGNLMARLMLEVMAVFAGHERRVIKERQKVGQANKRAAGGHIGGSAPFGYDIVGRGKNAQLVPNEKEQEALAYAKQMRESGQSFRAISDALKSQLGVSVSYESLRKAFMNQQKESSNV